MNLIQVFQKFSTENDCIKHLESIRWKDKVTCANCGSAHTVTHNVKGVETRSGRRFQCQDCNKSFWFVGAILHHLEIILLVLQILFVF